MQHFQEYGPNPLLEIGKVIDVAGPQIVVELDQHIVELSRVYEGRIYRIGQFGSLLKVHFGSRCIYAMVRRLRMKADYDAEHGVEAVQPSDARVVEADLVGERVWSMRRARVGEDETGFVRGVANFPLPQQSVYLVEKRELESILSESTDDSVVIGQHVGGDGIPCRVDVNELFGKHAAVLGSTGSGKSATVAAVLHAVSSMGAGEDRGEWNPKIVVFDPHNEYSAAFADATVLSSDRGNLRFPYWMFNLQEMIELVVGRSERAATAQASIVKDALTVARLARLEEVSTADDTMSVDSPVPFSLEDLKKQIEDKRKGVKGSRASYDSVLEKLRILREDQRMSFMMAEVDEEFTMSSEEALMGVMTSLMSSPGWPLIVDLSGVPNEIAGLVTGMICRSVFNWKVWQSEEARRGSPVVVVCEEAHLYVPDRGEAQYASAQQAVRTLVREGRKYGIGVMIVSQRPSELDATVLSQCSSWIVMRITNDVDRQQVRAALPDALGGFVGALPSLRRREALVVGLATALPARVEIVQLPEGKLPRSQDVDFVEGWRSGGDELGWNRETAMRWQRQGRGT